MEAGGSRIQRGYEESRSASLNAIPAIRPQKRLRSCAFAVALVALAVYGLSPVKIQTDSIWTIPTVASILDRGDTNLDEYSERIARQAHGTAEIDGHLYSNFPIGPSIAALPFVFLIDQFAHGSSLVLPEGAGAVQTRVERWEQRFHAVGDIDYGWFNLIELVVASFYTAASIGFVFLAAARRSSLATSAAVALSVAFGTSAWSTASRVLWQHGPSMCAIAIVVYLLTRKTQTRSSLLLLGTVVAVSYVFRPTNSITVVIVSAYIALLVRRRVLWYLLGATVVAIPFCLYNLSVFHALLPPYYLAGRLDLFSVRFLEALAGNLFSPARGLFVWSPFLLLALASAVKRVRDRSLEPVGYAFGAILVLHWISISAFPHWWGGHSVGSRFFTDVLPYWAWFLVAPFDSLIQSFRARPLRPVAAALLIAFSVFAHGRGAISPMVHAWNDGPPNVDDAPHRVWDFTDLQFLRGL